MRLVVIILCPSSSLPRTI